MRIIMIRVAAGCGSASTKLAPDITPASTFASVPGANRHIDSRHFSQSDNTATNHLLFLLGRKHVEPRMQQMGHHDPALNTPLFATREFAIIKFLWSDEQLREYEQASVAERRRLLAAEQRGWPELEAYFEENGPQTEPVRIESVEWFADSFDMCRALIELDELGQDPRLRPVLEVLTVADQIGVDRERFT